MAQNRREQVQQRRAQPDHQRDLLILILEGELDGIHGLSTDEKPRICTTLYIYNYITRQMLICIHLWYLAIFFLAGSKNTHACSSWWGTVKLISKSLKGHKTTANALSFALHYLARYPINGEMPERKLSNCLVMILRMFYQHWSDWSRSSTLTWLSKRYVQTLVSVRAEERAHIAYPNVVFRIRVFYRLLRLLTAEGRCKTCTQRPMHSKRRSCIRWYIADPTLSRHVGQSRRIYPGKVPWRRRGPPAKWSYLATL